ncbi:hypothetical protein ZWY2020_039186 [Hordeum vulgare]|nr:hypothetical protein ZWY2020_039186 [Hordeum vulgare]
MRDEQWTTTSELASPLAKVAVGWRERIEVDTTARKHGPTPEIPSRQREMTQTIAMGHHRAVASQIHTGTLRGSLECPASTLVVHLQGSAHAATSTPNCSAANSGEGPSASLEHHPAMVERPSTLAAVARVGHRGDLGRLRDTARSRKLLAIPTLLTTQPPHSRHRTTGNMCLRHDRSSAIAPSCANDASLPNRRACAASNWREARRPHL